MTLRDPNSNLNVDRSTMGSTHLEVGAIGFELRVETEFVGMENLRTGRGDIFLDSTREISE